MDLKCLFCDKYFIVDISTVRFIGPYLRVYCPHCREVYEGKVLDFVDKHTANEIEMLKKARKMIALAQALEKICNNDDVYEDNKKAKKRVKENVPDL